VDGRWQVAGEDVDGNGRLEGLKAHLRAAVAKWGRSECWRGDLRNKD
jgi:hypothetical protein